MESKKQNKKQTHRYRQQTGGCQRGRELAEWKWMKRVKRYKFLVRNKRHAVMYITGNMLNNIVIPLCGDRW